MSDLTKTPTETQAVVIGHRDISKINKYQAPRGHKERKPFVPRPLQVRLFDLHDNLAKLQAARKSKVTPPTK